MISSTNPYSAPQLVLEPVDRVRERARIRLRVPALGLTLVGATSGVAAIALATLAIIMDVYYLGADATLSPLNAASERLAYSMLISCLIALYGVVQGLVFYGALQMRRLKSYRWAMTATVLSLMPQPFLVVSLPLGVWALWRLRQPIVRGAFAR